MIFLISAIYQSLRSFGVRQGVFGLNGVPFDTVLEVFQV